jgi:hypothetical protein
MRKSVLEDCRRVWEVKTARRVRSGGSVVERDEERPRAVSYSVRAPQATPGCKTTVDKGLRNRQGAKTTESLTCAPCSTRACLQRATDSCLGLATAPQCIQ